MPFLSTTTEIVGELDQRWRPLVEVQLFVNAVPYRLRCHIDTGCDDDLVFRDYADAASLGLQFRLHPSAMRHERVLANGTPAFFVEARATIEWFAPRLVTVLAPDPNIPPASPPPQHDEIPRVLLGVPLLIGCAVGMSFSGPPGEIRIYPLSP